MMTVRHKRRIVWTLGVLTALAAGCPIGDFCPAEPGIPLKKTRLEGTWRLSMLGDEALPGPSREKSTGRSLMIPGKTFLTFDLLGNLQYIGTLGADETVGLWEINLRFGLSAVGLTLGSPDTEPIDVTNIQSSVAEMPDGSITVRMGWRRGAAFGTTDEDVLIVLEQMRFGPTENLITALMSVTENDEADPAPAEAELIGEVLLERIEPEIRELIGDIHPAGEIVASGGPPPPYNDNVTFAAGQFFTLDASQTAAPAGTDLTYHWRVVRELTDPNTGQVVERDRLLVLSLADSGFVATSPGRYYVTLYVTDGVLWRSTQGLGPGSEMTRFVTVE